MLQSLLILAVPALGASAEELSAAPQNAAGANTLLALSNQPQGIPAALEGDAKAAVEQALRKSVDKTKVH